MFSYVFYRFRDQRKQLVKIMRAVNMSNPFMLKAILDPEDLLKREVPQCLCPGGVSEAHEALPYTWRYFHSIPGAKDFLKGFVYPSLSPSDPLPPFKPPVEPAEDMMGCAAPDKYHRTLFMPTARLFGGRM